MVGLPEIHLQKSVDQLMEVNKNSLRLLQTFAGVLQE